MKYQKLIFDWNTQGNKPTKLMKNISVLDETLRDGLQSPYVKTPSVEERIEIVRFAEKVGIECVDIGIPSAAKLAQLEIIAIAKGIAKQKINIQVCCAGRMLEKDIDAIAEISQQSGLKVEAALFIGSSSIRSYIEEWDMKLLRDMSARAVSYAVKQGLNVNYVTEDTTRSRPEIIQDLYRTAVDHGASRVCVCDTTGFVTPDGTYNLISFVRNMLNKFGLTHVMIDFHGHMDRGLGVWNSIVAYRAGANRTHGCALGIGERCGNTPIDQLLINLQLLGWIKKNLVALPEYARCVATAFGVTIPENYPGLGNSAFETATGVHASAILKALRKNDIDLTDHIYSGVSASLLGRTQIIRIGPMSGKSNVRYWLEQHQLTKHDDLINWILKNAKDSDRVLQDDEIFTLIEKWKRGRRAA